MPMPEPQDDEDYDKFINRCMGDDVMTEEYEEQDRRRAVCENIWSDRGQGKTQENQTLRNLRKGVRYERGAVEMGITAGGKEGNGWIEGYASTFGNVDSYNEVVDPGAYAKSVNERVPGLPLMVSHLAHGGDANDVIGEVTEAKEDGRGLWVHAELDDSELAQKTREQVIEGTIGKMSVGYEMILWEVDRRESADLVRLKELKLMDVIVTMAPVNEEAVITAAKEVADAVRRQQHLEVSQIREMVDKLRGAAKELESLAVKEEPEDTAEEDSKAAVTHCNIDTRRKRLNLLKL